MADFFADVAKYHFLQYALLAGVLVSVASGVMGTYVVVRRITYIAGSIAHCVLGGLGAAQYFQVVHGWTWLEPIYGAALTAVGAAMIIGIVTLKAKQREDTVIGALWAIGMSVGVLFIARTPGYQADIMRYLFGDILMVGKADLVLTALLDLAVVTVSIMFYNKFQAVCFDEEFARLRGVQVEFYYLLLLVLTALTVVLLMKVVGIVMVIALLTLPVAVAGYFARSLWQMMVVGTLLSALFTTSGLAISYKPNLPAGATIIVLAGAVYLLTAGGRMLVRRRE
jgi:zinc transport system permease protein